MFRLRRSHAFLNLLTAAALLTNLVIPLAPAIAAPPAPTFTPPVESGFQGATQATVAGPMGLDVSIYDLSLRAVRTDLFIPGCAVPLQATFIFEPDFGDSPFGYGWRFVYAASYTVQADGALLIGPINGHRERFIPGDGRLVRTQPGRYQLHLDNGDTYYFDDPSHQQVTKIEASGGGFLLLTYDASRQLTRLTDHYGRHLDFTYTNGRLAAISDANAHPNRTVHYSYDTDGNLVSVTDPVGQVTKYDVTGAHQLRRVTEPGGNWAAVTYVRELSIPSDFPDGVAQIATATGTVSFQRKIVYKIPGSIQPLRSGIVGNQAIASNRQIIANFATVTDVVGGRQRTTRYDFSLWDGQLSQITDPLGSVTTFGWDAQGNLRQLTDENGDVTSYLYNGAGQLIQSTDPLARVTKYTYDGSGQIASLTDPLNRTTTYQYDSAGNLASVTDPLGNITSYDYDSQGKLVSVTDPLSNTLSYTYDAFGFPASVQDGAGVKTTYAFSARGDLLTATDGRSRTTSYGIDALGRPITITNPAGEITRLAYDANGNIAQLFDPAGRIVDYAYDASGRPIQIADAQGTTNYTFDAAGNIIAIRDGEGNRDQFSYDLNGRLIARSDGLNRTTSFTYDLAGNLTSRIDPIGQTTVYTYSAASQLVAIGYPDGTAASYAYDAAGNLLQEANGTVTVDYTYDAADRLTSVTAGGKTTSYAYDAAGRRLTMTDPDGNTTSYSYDGAGRLRAVIDPLAGTVDYTYDAAGKLSRLDRANGVYSLYTYDAADRLQAITHHAPDHAVLDSFTYTYDPAGNRTSVTSASDGTTTYSYDGRYQLAEVAYPDGTSTTYAYDLAGNRLSEDGTSYNYDAAAQLLSAGPTIFNWDARGNQLGKTGSGANTVYSYDHENRLTGATFADSSNASYAYYPDGRLFSRTDRAGQTTRFYYDGPNLLLETDGSGGTLARYTNGLHLDAWLAMQRGGQNYDYLHDGLNSITGLTDSSGALASSYQYDAFGRLSSQSGSVPNPILFTGRYWDADVELYQYRARWYDPTTGRFTSRDPLGPINVRQAYTYVYNNPATSVDPLGLDTWSCDSGKFSIGLLVGYERTNLRCTNQRTGETCSLLQKCWKLGALAGVTLGGCGGRMFNGPARGENLANDGGYSITAGIGGGFGVGGEISGNTSTEDSGSELNLCGGVGSFGLEFELGGQRCTTTVLSCTRPPEPKPRPSVPPRRPGADHADDNYSAASSNLPSSNYEGPIAYNPSLSQSPAGTSLPLVGQPRVGVLWHGYAEEAQALLASWGWPSAPVDIAFDPAALEFPVLFIPSGGLYGLDSAPSIRARLEAFVAGGGVIISLAQQRGHEFSTLPGGELNGYGWAEDNSCFDASLYVSAYHPLLSGFNQSTLTAGVDGFFTGLPTGAQTLLNRSRDGQPGLTLYPYKSGWVAATSLYDDWGGANYQPPADSARLLRDLLSWGVDASGPLPDFSPAMTATLPITVVNAGLVDTARIRFQTFDPNGKAVMTQTLDLPLPAGGQGSPNVQQANLPPRLGIWWIQYTLLDASDNVVQPATWGGRFAVSDPNPATGPGKEMSLSITAPTEDFVPGSATFTFHVRNFTTSPRTATVAYGFPHHTWETGDPSYGDFHGLSRGVDVPPQSEITFTHTAEILTNDRLFARLYDATFSQNAWFQIRMAPAAVDIDLEVADHLYRRGQTVPLTVTVQNLQRAAQQVTLDVRVEDSQGALLHRVQQVVPLTAEAAVTTPLTFTIPITAQYGTAVLYAVAQDAMGGNLNAAHDSFTIPDSPLTFAAILPDTLSAGASAQVVVSATNNSPSLNVLTATLAMTITSPDGSSQTAPPQPFALAAAQSLTLSVPFTVPAAQFGQYAFDFMVADEYGQHGWRVIDYNEPVISSSFDQPAVASGDLVKMKVTVQNSGHWSQNLALLVAPEIAASITIPLSIEPGKPASITVDIPLPTGMTAGSYPFTSTLIPPTGNTIATTASVMVPDADLRISMADRALTSGLPISLTVSNKGGVDASAEYTASLRDTAGITIQTVAGTMANVPPGSDRSFAFPVPSQAATGSYALGGVLTNTQSGIAQPFIFLVTVAGANAAMNVHTQQTVYVSGQAITASAQVSNTGLIAIDNAAINLAVDAPPAWSWFTHRPGHHGPSSGISTIVTDTAGVKWMVAHRAVNAFDDGGTPFDLSDDRWQVFDVLNGLPHQYAYYVFVDSAGFKWINSWGPAGSAFSVLDDGGTPFDVSDDQWLHYTASDGLPAQSIKSMAEDLSGNLWLGFPWVGAAVFNPGADPMSKGDDSGWAYFTTAEGLANNSVNAVTIDADGNKWFGTDGGASVLDDGGTPLDTTDDKWNSFFSPNGLPDNRVIGMAIDVRGYKWFAGGGISGGAPDQIIGVLDTGPSPFDTITDTFQLFKPTDPNLYGFIDAFSLDDAGRAWFSVPTGYIGLLDTGTTPFDGSGDSWGAFAPGPRWGLTGSSLPDGDNRVWLGTSDGIAILDHNGTPFVMADDTRQRFTWNAGIGEYRITAITEGEAGMTWFGSSSGLRVLDPMATPADPADDQWMLFEPGDGLPAGSLKALHLDQQGYPWMAPWQEAAVLDHGGTPFDKSDDTWATLDIGLQGVYDLDVDSANLKWFAGWSNGNTHGLAVLDDGGTPITKTDDLTMTFAIPGLLSNSLDAIAIDQSGVKWVINYGEAIAFMDGGTPFDPSDDHRQLFNFSATNHYLSDVAVDGQNNIWFAFNSSPNGVAVLDYNGTLTDTLDDGWRYFNSFNGLVDNWVLDIAIDTRGDKWFATPEGLSRLDDGGDPIDGLNDTWESFTTEVGMGDPAPEVDVVAVGGDGNIWAGTFEHGASVAVWQGTAVWSAQQPVATLPTIATTQIITDVVNLTSPGRYLLRGEFVNAFGQTLANSRSPFYIVSGQTALTLDATPDPVRNGATITLTGALTNGGASLFNQTVQLYQDGVLIHSEGPFNVAAGASHNFTATTSAPLNGVSSVFIAVHNSLSVELTVAAGRPSIAASAAIPPTVSSAPFTVTTSLTNTGAIAGQVQISVDGQLHTVTVPPGSTVLAQSTAQTCTSMSLPVILTGDATQTINVPVNFGQQLSAAFTPSAIYRPGVLTLPYTLTNTGSLDIAFATAITVEDSHSVVASLLSDTYLISTEAITGTAVFELPAGSYDLTYNLDSEGCSLASGQESFTVAPASNISLSVTAGLPSVAVPITVTLANQGSEEFHGALQLATDYDFLLSRPVSLTIGASSVVTFAADAVLASSGVHTATVSAVSAAGKLEGQAAATYSIVGPLLQITAMPGQTTLPVSQTVTLTFGVSNLGDQDGQAEFRFALGDIEDETQLRRIAAGESSLFDVKFFVPPELEAKDYLATYELNGQPGYLLLTVQGISLTATAAVDQVAYREGDPVQLHLTVSNNQPGTGPSLYALVSLDGITLTKPFTPTAAPANLTFPLTATFANGGLIFYGIYHQASQRAIALNTFRLSHLQETVTVLLDRQRYAPGDGVKATIVTAVTGQVEIAAPGYTATLPLSGSNSNFNFTLPAAMSRGSHAVTYRLTGCGCEDEGRAYQAMFEVDGPLVRVTDASLGRLRYVQADPVTVRLLVSSDRAVDGVLKSELVYPDGRVGATVSTPVTLKKGPANVLTATATITSSISGIHFLRYTLVDALDQAVAYADGIEALDLGPASLIAVSTEEAVYAANSGPVTATVSIFASMPISGQLSLALEVGPAQDRTLNLPAGWHSITTVLAGPIPPGPKELTATLAVGGYISIARTGFEYGSDLPDLVAGRPWIDASGLITRSLMALVTNQGRSSSPPSTVHFFLGDPASGGSLIASTPLAGLSSEQSSLVLVEWAVQGQGGDHEIHVVVDPVQEFDTVNNKASNVVTLPRLEATLLVNPTTIAAGGTMGVAVTLSNLQGTEALSAAPVVEIVEPGGHVVFTHNWSVLLAGGESRILTTSWLSASSQPGNYLVKLTAIVGEEIYRAKAFFTIEEENDYTVYLPVVMRSVSQAGHHLADPPKLPFFSDFSQRWLAPIGMWALLIALTLSFIRRS